MTIYDLCVGEAIAVDFDFQQFEEDRREMMQNAILDNQRALEEASRTFLNC